MSNFKIIDTEITDVKLIEPKVFDDDRGHFFESFNKKSFNQAIGLNVEFVQDNLSRSSKHVIRGLHYHDGTSLSFYEKERNRRGAVKFWC